MNLKKSWVNIPLLKNSIKQNIVFAKVSLVVVCVFSVVGIINSSASMIALGAFGLSSVLLTTCYAGFVQKYMTQKTEAGFIASLPIDSFTLWCTQYLAGLILVVGTLFIESVCIAIMSIQITSVTITPIYLIMTTVFLSIFYYTVSYFVSCMAGNRLGQFMYTIVFYALPLLLYVGIEILAGFLAPYGNGLGANDILYLWLPLVSGLEFLQNGYWPYFIGHVALALVFLIGGYYVFKNRSIENTGSALLYDKVNFFLKILVVIALTLFAFIMITQAILIVPNYAFTNIIKAAVIFVVLGVLLALLIEMLFHSEHMYTSLIYYVPALLLCFVGCYFYGNYQYQQLLNTMSKIGEVEFTYNTYIQEDQMDGNMYYSMEHHGSVALHGKTAQKMIHAMERQDLLSSWTVSNVANPMEMNFLFNDSQNRYLTIYVSKDVVQEILTKDTDILHEVANSYYAFDTSMFDTLDLLYINGNSYYDEENIGALDDILSILDRTQIEKLKEYIDTKQYIKVDTMFTSTYTAFFPKGAFTIVDGDSFIHQLIHDEKATKRAKQLNECVQILNIAGAEKIAEMKSSYPHIFTTQSFYYHDFDVMEAIEFIDEQTIVIHVDFTLESDTYESADVVSTKCTFTEKDNTMVLTNVEKVGDK